jgi:hypothetical protein
MMNQSKKHIDATAIYRETENAKYYASDIITRANQLANDPDKVKRLEKNECPSCFYVHSGRMGGAACTTRPCGICEKDMRFGSTCTDVICADCAKTNGLCKHCGGDIEMKHRRKKRPFENEDKPLD